MGDEPLLPLNTRSHSKVRATSAQTPAAPPDKRQYETIAEIWPEISFRQKEIWLGVLLEDLRRHFRQRLTISLVRCEDEVRFLLEDTASQTQHQLTLPEACRILENSPDASGQLLDQEC